MDNINNNKFEDENVSFSRIALALASDYTSVYLIDKRDDSYIEYSVTGSDKQMQKVASGKNFFADTVTNSVQLVYREDLDYFLDAFKKENFVEALKNGKSFSLNYRLVLEGRPQYFYLKTISEGSDDDSYIVIGVQNVDEQVRREKAAAEEVEVYSQISKALASRYEVIYYIDIETNAYLEYSASDTYAKLGLINKGNDFFLAAYRDIKRFIHPEDSRRVIAAIDKESLLKELETSKSVSIIYRQLLDDRTQYVKMVVVRPENDSNKLVIGVINVDDQIRREKTIAEESNTFSNIVKALALRYEVIYYVNIETGAYKEYTSSDKYAKLAIGLTGDDFFGDTQRNMKFDIFPDDYAMMAESMKKETLLSNLHETGSTSLNYRLILDGRPQYVTLFAIRPKEDSSHIIVAVANVDAAKRRENAFKEALGSAMDLASKDALTCVKNKHAYVKEEEKLDNQIAEDVNPEFALVVCDVNGLKTVNDTQGHRAGDDFIRSACNTICIVFKHSPVYRIGGDEFAVILKGHDYEYREKLMADLRETMELNRNSGKVTAASGMSVFERGVDLRVQDVFERADSIMYENKKLFKI